MRKKNNLDWLVAARGYAMYGVFLTHMMATYINEQHITVLKSAIQYSEPTLLPFFAILTGAFYSRPTASFGAYLKLKFSQRMFPVYLYLLLIIPFYCLLPVAGKTVAESLKMAPLYLLGIPLLSWPSWFLVALFTSELLYFFIAPYAKKTRTALLLALTCYTLVWIYQHYLLDMPVFIGMLGMVWMLQASLLFCAFFLVGAVAKPYLLKMTHWHNWQVAIVALASLLLTVLALHFNQFRAPASDAPEFFRQIRNPEMIVISTGQYGHYFWFMLCTLAGSLAFVSLCRLIPVNRFMRACGDHSLVLLGLNGIFLNVLNAKIIPFFVPPNSLLMSLLYATVLAAITIAISLPIAILLEKYLPQLTGKPMIAGPLLPALYKKKS